MFFLSSISLAFSVTKNSRIDNIIQMWGIQNRLIVDENFDWVNYIETPIDFDIVSQKSGREKNRGIISI